MLVPQTNDDRDYWRRVLRAASLCHDLGHLPFSHAAEGALLPEGLDHERFSADFIRSQEMRRVWKGLDVEAMDVVRTALGQKKWKEEKFTDWQAILAEIVTGDVFGADRIDYLLRDSHHLGVSYGRFDHHRLIESLRILPKGQESEGARE